MSKEEEVELSELMGEEIAKNNLPLVFRLMEDVPLRTLEDMMNQIERYEGAGPLLNPGEFVGGEGFRDIDRAKKRLRGAIELKKKLIEAEEIK